MNVTRQKNSLIVELSGEIDHHSSMEIKDAIDAQLDNSKVKNIVFDFSNVEFMDSSGVGLIIGRYKTVKVNGGNAAITGVSGTVDRILDISGIYKLMRRCATPAEALKAVEGCDAGNNTPDRRLI